jgi:hypothetical protein
MNNNSIKIFIKPYSQEAILDDSLHAEESFLPEKLTGLC